MKASLLPASHYLYESKRLDVEADCKTPEPAPDWPAHLRTIYASLLHRHWDGAARRVELIFCRDRPRFGASQYIILASVVMMVIVANSLTTQLSELTLTLNLKVGTFVSV